MLRIVSLIFAGLVVLAAGAAGAAGAPSAAGNSMCPADVCGTLMRPLDPRGLVPGQIAVPYRVYRHRHAGPATGTIVTQEGGPGAPASGTADKYYLPLFDPLRDEFDIVMVDARGTGRGALNCPRLQKAHVRTAEMFGECGRSLRAASVLYGTRLAVADMKAVLDHLQIAKIDYYGDSYGTFFGQVFAAMYPDMLRSVVLDGAFAVIGQSPWSSNAGVVVRDGFNAACERTPACAKLGGHSIDRIRALVDRVRAQPIHGALGDGHGHNAQYTIDAGTIGFLLYGGTQGPIVYRDLGAAARAYMDGGDAQPLLRLAAENDANLEAEPVADFSYGLYGAVACMDYQQIYDMNAPIAERRAQRDAALATKRRDDANVYDPITIDDFLRVPIDTSLLDQCLYWPIDNPPYPPGKPIPEGRTYTSAPTLVMNGELDALTPPRDGALVATQFPHATHVIVANSFHVDALGDVDHCAEGIVRRFVRDPSAPIDASCAPRVRPVRLVPFFPRRAADATPATPLSGNAATAADLAVASAAVQTAGDVVMRSYLSGHDGAGLRGGRWSWTKKGDVVTCTLSSVKWTDDLAVSGRAVWDQRDGSVRATLTYRRARITVSWNDEVHDAVATLSGSVGNRTINATMPAP